MKFNQRKILSTFALVLSSTLPAFGMPYDEKSAWCSDYASNKTSIYSNTLSYDMTKAYKYCMKKTPEKIIQQQKKADEKRQKEVNEYWRIENERQREQERKERAEKARLRAEEKEKKRLKELKEENRLDELFGDF